MITVTAFEAAADTLSDPFFSLTRAAASLGLSCNGCCFRPLSLNRW